MSATSPDEADADRVRTSICLMSDTKGRFDAAKPGGLTCDQFTDKLLAHWQGERAAADVDVDVDGDGDEDEDGAMAVAPEVTR